MSIEKDLENIIALSKDYNEHLEYGENGISEEVVKEEIDEGILMEKMKEYIQESYPPKTTSTDIEELESAVNQEVGSIVEQRLGLDDLNRDIISHITNNVMLVVKPHLSNKSELKKEAVREFIDWFIDEKHTFYYGENGIDKEEILETYLSSDEKNSKLGGKE